MRTLILNCDYDENSETNGACLLRYHLNSQGIYDVDTLDVHRGLFLDERSIRSYKRNMITGSRASVYDDIEWLNKLFDMIFVLDNYRIPTLGICFGFQAIAQAFGGNVRGSGAFEEGYKEVQLTDKGKGNPLFNGLPHSFMAYQSHGDIADRLPEGAEVLARSISGTEAYSLRNFSCVQFHPEILPETAVKMARRDGKNIGDILNSVGADYLLTKGILRNFASRCES